METRRPGLRDSADERHGNVAEVRLEGLKGNALVTVHTYPEMNHAFARPGGAHYDKACADLANGRTSTFFRQHLS